MHGMSVKQKQQQILKSVRKGGTPSVFSEEAITAKESENEMIEIFSHKLALTNKINYNLTQQDIIRDLAKKETDRLVRKALKDEHKKRQAAILKQIRERSKLSGEKIGKQLGFSTSYIQSHYNAFVRAAV